MNAKLLEKLLSPETSAEERDVLCEVAYGASFLDSLSEIRREDFADGLEKGRYLPTSIFYDYGIDAASRRVEIHFMCVTPGLVDMFLYDIEYDTEVEYNYSHLTRPAAHYVKFADSEIDEQTINVVEKAINSTRRPR